MTELHYHRQRLFIWPDATCFSDTGSHETHDGTPSSRRLCGDRFPSFPVAGFDSKSIGTATAWASKTAGGAGQDIWTARAEGELSD